MKTQLFSIKPDIIEICKNVKQCHCFLLPKMFVLGNIVIFHKIFMLICNVFIMVILNK